MKRFSLRLRVFLFFCLMCVGSVLALCVALWMGFRQLGDPNALSAFVTTGIIAVLGITALPVFVWLLFDENVSKPIEALAAHLRVGAHANVAKRIDEDSAKYLGDLAPAASAIHQKLSESDKLTTQAVETRTAQLEREREQLMRILSDIPIAVIVARSDHQIVLYDGQAAVLMEKEAPALLNGSVFDYVQRASIEAALDRIAAGGKPRRAITVTGHSGAVYSGHIRKFEGRDGYTLMLEPLDPDAERPLTFDFSLFEADSRGDLNDTPLRQLNFVVFDSETTGLDPKADDVVQIGAVRIVNGKRVQSEAFESLVNPGRPIPAASTKVHGVSTEMVQDAPRFDTVCQAFHKFSNDAVIVAHNAPFDMAFLHRQSKPLGLSFDHPILDTVHLSAVVFGGSAKHTLDALCDRLDITIPPELRHTAMGDAVATADVLVALIPVLEARGISTLGQARAEIEKHRRILTTDA